VLNADDVDRRAAMLQRAAPCAAPSARGGGLHPITKFTEQKSQPAVPLTREHQFALQADRKNAAGRRHHQNTLQRNVGAFAIEEANSSVDEDQAKLA
jgi:hypothetical protein